jgi:hypothetical protein
MLLTPSISPTVIRLGVLAMTLLGPSAYAQAPSKSAVPPAPVVFRWPDPAFRPDRQCHGGYARADLDQYWNRARPALWLPSTRGMAIDSTRGCLVLTVDGVGAGRLAQLILRGTAVPRRAVLLRLTAPEARRY